MGIHTLTTSQSGADGGGVDTSCDGGVTCCAQLAQCCPHLDGYPSVEGICESAVDSGVEQECAELLPVYRPECP